MSTDEALQRIEAEAEQARANAKANGETTLSGAFDAGRCSGLLEAAGIVAQMMRAART